MSFEDYIKINVLDTKKIKSLGYNSKIYYCGNHTFQKLWTYVRDQLELMGVKFPYNPACYLHDNLYGEIYISNFSLLKKFKLKMQADFKFHKDMMLILQSIYDEKKINDTEYRILKKRANYFYYIVIMLTPVYFLQHIYSEFIQKRKNGIKK